MLGGKLLTQHIMSIEYMKNASFPPPTDQAWKEKVEASLKGREFEVLKKDTYENIVLKPLYSETTQTTEIGYPGVADYRRGLHALGYHSNPWKVAQKVSYHSLEDLQRNLSNALERGQTALSFKVRKELFEEPEELEKWLFQLVEKAPLAIEADGLQNSFLSLLNEGGKTNVTGYVAEDPMAILVNRGSLPFDINEYFNAWIKTIKDSDRSLPHLKTVLIDTTPYHNGGANAVQELAIALSTGVFYLEELKVRGLAPQELFMKMIFKFQIGANFFMELSKLRAARVLWNKIGEAYGIPPEKRGMEIIAETSTFTKSLTDQHVNILRSGNEAFAAVLGGVQYLHVHAFNELERVTPLAERLARNTQLILKQEAFIQDIVDPSGGSWYIESLTNELVHSAWEYFLTIDEKGGIMQVLESNWLQTEIAALLNKRQLDTFTRKQSIVGTNVYANLQDSVQNHLSDDESPPYEKQENLVFHSIQPIAKQRLSEPYENLRISASQLDNNQVGLVCIGELKEYKARADFMTGFLAAGGLQGVNSQELNGLVDAHSFILKSNLKHYVLCSSNENYQNLGFDLLKQLKKELPDVHFYLAGLPDKETQDLYLEAGIRDFVHLKTNCYEFNSSIIYELKEGGTQ
jgi:methylmalonyl-CoA mutase